MSLGTRINADTQLHGSVDMDGMMSKVSDEFMVRGLFFRRAIEALGSELERYQEKLLKPTDRYIPFKNYPQADHGRLSIHAARKVFPGCSDREALRRYARADMDDFAESMFGKVMLSMVGHPKKALSLYPSVYEKVAPGPWQMKHYEEDGDYIIHFGYHTSDWSYQLGQLEGVVGFYGKTTVITVTEAPPAFTYRISIS